MTRRQQLNIAAAASAVRVLERCAPGFRDGPEALQRARATLARLERAAAQEASQGVLWGVAETPQLDLRATRKPSWL